MPHPHLCGSSVLSSPLLSRPCPQGSSICKAAIHAGVVGADGGLVDVLALDKRKSYVGVLKNGVQSERCDSLRFALLAAPRSSVR